MDGKILRLVAVVAVLARPIWAAPGSKPDAKPETDLKRLQGTWLYQSQTIGGRPISDKDRGEIWIEIEGETLTLRGTSGLKVETRMVLDPKASPKAIDFMWRDDASGKSFIHKGIYEWDGETLRMCFDNTGKERPKEFKSPEGKDNISLSVLNRKEK